MSLKYYFFVGLFLMSTICFSIRTTYSSMYGRSESKIADNYFKKAYKFEMKKDLKNAKKFYLKAIKEDPRFIEAYDNLGRIYRYNKNYDEAVKLYKKSINLYPAGHVARMNLALVYKIQKLNKKAAKEYKTMIKLFPKNPEGYYGLANLYLSTQEFEKSIKYAKKALKIYKEIKSPYITDVYQSIGLAYYYNKNNKKAKKYFKLARDNGAEIPLKIEYDLFKDELNYKRMFQLKSKKDYKETEKYVINATNWLVNKSTGQKTDKQQLISGFLMKWAEESPYISIGISEKIVTFTQNPNYLLLFIAGALKYSIETKDYKSKYKGSIAGVKAVIKFYLRNKKTLGVNENIENYIKLQKSKKLVEYIKELSK